MHARGCATGTVRQLAAACWRRRVQLQACSSLHSLHWLQQQQGQQHQGQLQWQQAQQQPQHEQALFLRRQRLAVPPVLAPAAAEAPCSVPVQQLLAVCHALLPTLALPKDARGGTMVVKWRLLQLLLLRARGEACFQARLDDLVDGVLLRHRRAKLDKVLAADRIPQPNKDAAVERHARLRADCIGAVAAWAAGTAAASAEFSLLRPALEALVPALQAPMAAAEQHAGAAGRQRRRHHGDSGRRMEEEAVQCVRRALPPGWSVLPNVFVIAANGSDLNGGRGCKQELDMLVLDDAGLAVAVLEVKLAAANPLMALISDLDSLLRLVDRAQGGTLTCLLKSPSPEDSHAAAAAAAAAPAVEVQHPALARKAKIALARPPFAPAVWQLLHVRVAPRLQPVYVLGREMAREQDWTRGISSLFSSSALKLVSRSAADLAAALVNAPVHEAAQPQHGAGSLWRSDSSTSSCSDASSASSASSASDCLSSLAASSPRSGSLPDALSQLHAACSERRELKSACACIRTSLTLSGAQRAAISARISGRLQLLQERCAIFGLVPAVGGEASS